MHMRQSRSAPSAGRCYLPRVKLVRLLPIALMVAAGCTGESATASPGAVEAAFTSSAARAAVPRALLLAIAVVEEGLEIEPRSDIDVDNDVPAAGPLQLRRGRLDTLQRAAELAGTTEVELRKDPDRALLAGAQVLAEVGARTNARNDDLSSWSEAIEEMSGFADAAHRAHYAHRVFTILARGGSFPARQGELLELAPSAVSPALTIDLSETIRTLAAPAEYEPAEWIPTSCVRKCKATREGQKIELVIIHTTEANWTASVATLQNDPGKSVHYIIGTDGRVAQFITEATTGYHGGNIDYNERSIGVEHVGYATKPFTEAEYAVSARLVDHLTEKYAIPRDRAHIIGHDQIPNGTRIDRESPPCMNAPAECQSNVSYGGANHHTDPGIWEWAPYMARFGGEPKCNDAAPVFRCTNDRTQRYRCKGAEVSVERCANACESEGLDVDASCQVRPETFPVGADAPSSPPEMDEDEGCAIGRRGGGTKTATGLGLALAFALWHRRRRKD